MTCAVWVWGTGMSRYVRFHGILELVGFGATHHGNGYHGNGAWPGSGTGTRGTDTGTGAQGAGTGTHRQPLLPVLNFTRVDAVYDGLLSTGVLPYVELSFMPPALASGHDVSPMFYHPNISPPKSLASWKVRKPCVWCQTPLCPRI